MNKKTTAETTVKKEGAAPVENYKVSLGDMRDILIIAGIFLFFTGWIYIYFFYDYFGLSVSLVNIDYSSYLVYSFVVLVSNYGTPLIGLMALIFVYRRWLKKYINLSIFIALLLFPALYLLAKGVANQKASALRNSPASMRHVSFIFKEDAGFLSFKFNNDSVKNTSVKADLGILKDTSLHGDLYLLGQNNEYFFVLYQLPPVANINALPLGTVYFVNKGDVLYSKIGITSNSKL